MTAGWPANLDISSPPEEEVTFAGHVYVEVTIAGAGHEDETCPTFATFTTGSCSYIILCVGGQLLVTFGRSGN